MTKLTHFSSLILTSASMIALSAPLMAHAQENSPSTYGDDEIIVTATRRETRLQDVPIAVAALSGEAIAKTAFKDITDLAYTFSGLQFGDSPNDSGFSIRGVGTLGGFTSSSESPVGLVIDNVVIGIGSPLASLGDLERVEVLKGPQGTQFGKNASSGVINITTKRPDFENFGGTYFASYGSLNEVDINGSINVPVSDNSAFNLFVFHREHDGFINNTFLNKEWGGEQNYGGRAKFLFEPNDTLSIYAIADYSKQKHEGPGQLWTLNHLTDNLTAPGGRFGLPFVDLAGLGVNVGPENDVSIENVDSNFENENYGLSLQVDKELGDYTLSSVTAYREVITGAVNFGIDATPFDIFSPNQAETKDKFASQEIRITSPSGKALEYTGGVFVSRQETGLGSGNSAVLKPALPYSAFPAISVSRGISTTTTQSTSYAAYVDGRYEFSDQFAALGGLRITRDEIEAEVYSVVDPDLPAFIPPNPSNGFTPGGTLPYTPLPLSTGENSNTGVSGRVGMEYKPDDSSLFFATYARGYLGPTVTFSGITGDRYQVKPQTVDDFIIGTKLQFADRRVTLNANLFFDKYSDLQTAVFNGQEFITENAGGAETKGFEIEASARLDDNFKVNAAMTYSDAIFTDYITACPKNILAAGAAAVAGLCNATGSTASDPLYQAEGEPLPGAPELSVVLGGNYERELSDNLVFDIAANLSYKSDVQNSVGNPDTVQEAYSIVNASIGLADINHGWRLRAFARNLFDKNFNSAIIGLPFSDAGSYVNWRTREADRTYGVSLSGKF